MPDAVGCVGQWLFFMSAFLMGSSWDLKIALNGVSGPNVFGVETVE
jgi:hypothetical protein